MRILSYRGLEPRIARDCFVADNATISGDVTLEEGSSIWFSSVLRGEVEPITIGKWSNIQDNCTVHTDLGCPVSIGKGTSVGHNSVVHGASIGSNCLIGMGATILNGSKIGENCIVGAGALVLQDSVFSDNMLVLGSPATPKRQLTDSEIQRIKDNADHYSAFSKEYLAMARRKSAEL